MGLFMKKRKWTALLVLLAFVFTSIVPTNIAWAASGDGTVDSRVADATTLDAWQDYFGTSDTNFITQYAGHVWTDKSVTKDATAFDYATELADADNQGHITMNADENNFLVALSAMSASESVVGESNQPTDTMIVLDLSSSMYPKKNGKRSTETVSAMISAVNNTIAKLQALNVNNRVGVTIYFGGPDLNQAPATSYQLWLPLDRYEHNTNTFLTFSSKSVLNSVGVNTNVTNSSGQTVSASRTVPDVSGTYIQQGILSALDEFMAADTKVPETAAVNAGMPRKPVMILMSDGEPTAATNQYTENNVAAIMGSNWVDGRSAEQTDFLTQLTAAYAKEMMDVHYESEKPLFYTLSLGTSISYDVMDPSDTLITVPDKHPSTTISQYWSKLVANGNVNLNYQITAGQWSHTLIDKSCTVSSTTVDGKVFPSTVSQREYVDRAFVSATASNLSNAFDNIFAEIDLQTHTYPTLVGDDENLSGYVSFNDKIGNYMSVTDVKGILMGTHWYSGREFAKHLRDGSLGTVSSPTSLGDELVWSIQQRIGGSVTATDVRELLGMAYTAGQLNYNSVTGAFSNYVGWYASADGDYRGFWQEGNTTHPADAKYIIKSYMYLGETDDAHGVADSDMMYTTVRVRTEIATGEQMVSLAVPAALIPMVEYSVELDSNGNLETLTKGGAKHPIRLVYEVALDDEVTPLTLYDGTVASSYLEKKDKEGKLVNVNSDGSVNFYTNQWEHDNSVGYNKVNTYSYFRPSHQNENYYYQENATVYADQNGTVYTGSNRPTGLYYREIVYYKKNGNTNEKETYYRQLSEAALKTALKKSDNTWYIPAGNVHVNMDGYTINKSTNETGTLVNANTPFVDTHGHSVSDANHYFLIGDTLGNNGKVTLKPITGIKISKAVENVSQTADLTSKVFKFAITNAEAAGKSYDAIRVLANGTQASNTETVKFDNTGEAEVSLHAGESLYITGLDAGKTFAITEIEEADFIVSKVEVNGTTATGIIGEVITETNKISDVKFTNVPRGEGALTIAKLVEVPTGVSQTDKEFTVNVQMTGVAVSAGKTFTVEHSGDTSLTSVALGKDKSFDLTLKHGETVKISGIPEGTVATVKEENIPNGFTASYKVNDVVLDASATSAVVTVVKAPTIDNVTVVNAYNPSPVNVNINLSGEKTVTGNGWPDGQTFEFYLQKYDAATATWTTIATDIATSTEPAISFNFTDENALRFDKVGTYGYQVIEKNHGLTLNGITYDATMHTFDVVVTDDGKGQLHATVESSHAGGANKFVEIRTGFWENHNINFTNKNNQGHASVIVMIQKLLDNPSGSTKVSLEGYEFELYQSDSSFTTMQAITPSQYGYSKAIGATDASGETYVLLEYDYDQASHGPYYYKLKEKVGKLAGEGMTYSPLVYNFEVNVNKTDKGPVTATVTPGKVEIDNETDNKQEVSSDIAKWDTYISGADAEITYNLATFTNEYKPNPAEVTLDVSKKLINRELNKEDKFAFTLFDGNLNELMTVENDENGTIDFGTLQFTTVGVYEFKIQEKIGNDTNIDYDRTVYDVVITVTDNITDNEAKLQPVVDVLTIPGNNIVFVNEYNPNAVQVELGGKKVLEDMHNVNRPLGTFTFNLTESDKDGKIKDNGVTRTANNDANGDFSFGAIRYKVEDLSVTTPTAFYYVITEDRTADTDDDGLTYDETKYKVTVTVEYNKTDGKFTPKVQINNGSRNVDTISFTNRYEAADGSFVMEGLKHLVNVSSSEIALKADQFTFELRKSDAAWTKGTVVDIANNDVSTSNNQEGSFCFDKQTFTTPGAYYFIIDEVEGNEARYTYDSAEYGVKVSVTDSLDGQLIAKGTYFYIARVADNSGNETVTAVELVSGKVPEFYNYYGLDDSGAIFIEKAVKEVTGDKVPPKDAKFKFVMEIKATVNEWDAILAAEKLRLDKELEDAMVEYDSAKARVEANERLFMNSADSLTGSAYQFIMSERYQTSSGSAYEFSAIEWDGDVKTHFTTSSSYNFHWKAYAASDGKASVVRQIVEAIKALAERFTNINGTSEEEAFLKALQDEVTSPSAVGFVKGNAESLLQAQRDLMEAEAKVTATSDAINKFVEEHVTTASAVKVTLKPRSNNTDKLNELVFDLDPSEMVDGKYTVPFELFCDTGYTVLFDSTTGAHITYNIIEQLDDVTSKNYKRTEIDENGIDFTEGLQTGELTLDKDHVNTYKFTNIYDDTPDIPPYYPPYDPDPKPEPNPEPEPEKPKDPVEPDEPIEEPDVVEPGKTEELPEGVVPTGDTNRPMPYALMMLVGFFGMLFTRRKEN